MSSFVRTSCWRGKTPINAYRELIGKEALPEQQQYWSMCSRCSSFGPPFGNEYAQVIESGLIQPDQWRGVDQDIDIIKANEMDYPGVIWITSDFYTAMASDPRFNPGIINLDTMAMSTTQMVSYAVDVLQLADHKDFGSMLVVIKVAIVSGHISQKQDLRDTFVTPIEDELAKRGDLVYLTLYPEFFQYADHSTMGSFIYYRR